MPMHRNTNAFQSFTLKRPSERGSFSWGLANGSQPCITDTHRLERTAGHRPVGGRIAIVNVFGAMNIMAAGGTCNTAW